MCDAIRLRIRYETPDHTGETRRERNTRFGQESPEARAVEVGEYILEWFFDLSAGRQFGLDGPLPLAWIDMMAWATLTGNIVRAEEWSVIRAVDRAYLSALSDERAESAARMKAEQEGPRK